MNKTLNRISTTVVYLMTKLMWFLTSVKFLNFDEASSKCQNGAYQNNELVDVEIGRAHV